MPCGRDLAAGANAPRIHLVVVRDVMVADITAVILSRRNDVVDRLLDLTGEALLGGEELQ